MDGKGGLPSTLCKLGSGTITAPRLYEGGGRWMERRVKKTTHRLKTLSYISINCRIPKCIRDFGLIVSFEIYYAIGMPL